MPKFRKKPVVIEAKWFDGSRESGLAIRNRWPSVTFSQDDAGLWNGLLEMPTLEGTMKATVGDWIIQGVKGEIYPCKADIFDATYEPEEEYRETP